VLLAGFVDPPTGSAGRWPGENQAEVPATRVVGRGGEYPGEVGEFVDGVELAGYNCGRGMVMMVLETWILEFAIILQETK
jgi:hypothetical protein